VAGGKIIIATAEELAFVQDCTTIEGNLEVGHRVCPRVVSRSWCRSL
jgi:hypothetical protein